MLIGDIAKIAPAIDVSKKDLSFIPLFKNKFRRTEGWYKWL